MASIDVCNLTHASSSRESACNSASLSVNGGAGAGGMGGETVSCGDRMVFSSAVNQEKEEERSVRSSAQWSTGSPHHRKRIGSKGSNTSYSLQSIKSFVRTSKIANELTINKLRFSKLELYGRDAEKKVLLDCFYRMTRADGTTSSAPGKDGRKQEKQLDSPAEDVRHHQQRQLLLISGYSGVGKSALARELQAPVEKCHGFFLTGKFDLNQRGEPYAGIVTACRTLCMAILDLPTTRSTSTTENDDDDSSKTPPATTRPTLEKVQRLIAEELGSDAQILTGLIPLLGEILGRDNNNNTNEEGKTAKVGISEFQHQFNFAFCRFLKVIGSIAPVVLVMDDIQWSDVASMHLLEVLLSDTSINSLMVVGLYRSNEVHEAHLVNKWIRDIETLSQDNGIEIKKLELQNLEETHVNQLLSDLLSTDPHITEGLSKIVHKKTLGNVFFVVQFLQTLNDEELLEFNFATYKWLWNEQDVISHTSATTNVVELMRAKMQRLPTATRYILPLAACLGANFTEQMLELLVEHMPNFDVYLTGPSHDKEKSKNHEEEGKQYETSLLLDICEQEGLWEEVAPRNYQWLHDKIQEAALDLVKPEKLSAFQFHVGDILSMRLDPEILDEYIFVVVNLLSEPQADSSTVLDDKKRIQLATLFLQAGWKANESASFSLGGAYLRKGIGLLPDGHWERFYDTSLELYSLAAEAEFVEGDVQNLEKHCNEIIAQKDRPIEDKFRAYNVLVDSISGRNMLTEAMDLILSILFKLGCKLPKRGRMLHVIAGLVKAKAATKHRTTKEISKMVMMTDPKKLQAMRLLNKLTTIAYYANSELLPLAILKEMSWTIKYGISESSPPTFCAVGLILLDTFGDTQAGRIYTQYGLSILDRLDSRAQVARTIFGAHAFVLHWSVPVHDCMKPALKAYEFGMTTGDLESALWGIFFHLEFALAAGKPLHTIDEDLQVFLKQVQKQHQVYHTQVFMLLWQGILKLLGKEEHPTDICGQVIGQEFLKDAEDRKDTGVLAMIHRMQIFLAYWFGDDVCKGADIALKFGEEFGKANPGTPGGLYSRLHAALLCIDAGRRTRKRKYITYGKKLARMAKQWVEKGNPNILQINALLNAELAALANQRQLAISYFESAVLLAARRGFLHDQAKINERFASFALNVMNDDSTASFRIREAVKLYEEWGAQGKVNQLITQYKQFFQDLQPPIEIVFETESPKGTVLEKVALP